jgi:hypothetical protein
MRSALELLCQRVRNNPSWTRSVAGPWRLGTFSATSSYARLSTTSSKGRGLCLNARQSLRTAFPPSLSFAASGFRHISTASPGHEELLASRETPGSLPPSSDEMNGAAAARSKRKEPPHSVIDGRHPKHHRVANDSEMDSVGDVTPGTVGEFGEHDYDFDDARRQSLAVAPDSAEWQATIESVVRNVVSIRFCQTCSFDTDPALTSEATGFVVDAEKG